MLQDLFGDLRLRYGIKMGSRGSACFALHSGLAIAHDNWAILTVLVLMSARFVGSIAVKAIMRVIGTIAEPSLASGWSVTTLLSDTHFLPSVVSQRGCSHTLFTRFDLRELSCLRQGTTFAGLKLIY